MHEPAYVLLRHDDGCVSRMQFVTHRKRAHLDDTAAHACDFRLDDEGNWKRAANQDTIAREVARTSFPDDLAPVKSFDVVDRDTFMAARDQRRKAEPVAPDVATVWGNGPGDPPHDVANVIGPIAETISGIDQRLTQVVAALADLTALTTVRFQAIAAEQDQFPSSAKYPDLAAVLNVSDDAPAEVWHQAIDAFKKGHA